MSWTDPFLINSGHPTLRQSQAPTSEPMKVSASWWETCSPEKFTARASEERDRMVNDVIGRKVPDQIMGEIRDPR
jgi:hypothetical protein